MDGGKNLGGGTLARQKQAAREQPGTAGRDNVTRSARAKGVAKEGTRVARGSGRAAQGAGRGVAPLYERLPRGPHRLDPLEVAENQRRRMYGAMIEAVAASGYGRTSVKQVVTLAGVSRRAFY